MLRRQIRYIPRRLYSSVSNDYTPTIPEVKDTSNLGPADHELNKQAPNREHTWAPSQKPRSDAQTGPRFEQRDLARQPRPYAAIDLIAKEPVRYQDHSNVAVCDGGRGAQGHPKIFINLDKPGAHACLYCKSQSISPLNTLLTFFLGGLRFAKEEFREAIEAGKV
jgi:NADH dehydrogenase (ubiquinone) Fe-S protein 6